jgi:Domain of unknown function (DUF4832)/Domain of unknown function (DUF4874)
MRRIVTMPPARPDTDARGYRNPFAASSAENYDCGMPNKLYVVALAWVLAPGPGFAAASQGGVALATQTYQASHAMFANPDRGWIESINPASNDTPAPALTLSQLLALRNGPDHVTLVRKYYLLKAFREAPLPDALLNEFRSDLAVVRQAGMKLVPRFTYVWNTSPPAEDADVDRVLAHLDQLAPILSANADVLSFVEAGFVGWYGEWHDSSNRHVDNYTLDIQPSGLQIRNKLLQVLPADRMIAMRYLYPHKMKFWAAPVPKQDAHRQSRPARIGYHNDAVMSEPDWQVPSCGECPTRNDMAAYLAADTRWVLQSGEPLTLDDYSTTHDPRPELAEIHFSSLVRNANDDNDAVHYRYWREQGYYGDITRLLGYRFRLLESSIPNTIAPGQRLRIGLKLRNDGWAAPYNGRGLAIILRNQASGQIHRIELADGRVIPDRRDHDPRFWQPGAAVTVRADEPLPADLPIGRYDVLLHLFDPAPRLNALAAYAIRLANQGTWESATGYNKLRHTVIVR